MSRREKKGRGQKWVVCSAPPVGGWCTRLLPKGLPALIAGLRHRWFSRPLIQAKPPLGPRGAGGQASGQLGAMFTIAPCVHQSQSLRGRDSSRGTEARGFRCSCPNDQVSSLPGSKASLRRKDLHHICQEGLLIPMKGCSPAGKLFKKSQCLASSPRKAA